MGIYIPNMDAETFDKLCKEKGLQLIYTAVPPHGRLGDLDALADYVHQQDDWLSEAAIHAFCGILCKTPTIIPPEK